MSTAALSVQHLNKNFSSGLLKPPKNILKDVSFVVPSGSITGFVGVNGAGKTTTIKCLLRFIFPDGNADSKIQFFGESEFTPEVKRRIGYLPERPYLPEQLTAEEFLTLHWKLGGGQKSQMSASDTCLKTLARVNLLGVEKKYLREFSKGMLQRIGLAQALLHRPDLLILDEPMSGLDPDGRRIVKDILKEEQNRGATVFFSSHLLADMDELCSHLAVIDKGSIYFSGAVDDFTRAESKDSVVVYLDRDKTRKQIQVSRNELPAKLQEIFSQQGQLLKVIPTETTIESVFMRREWTAGNSAGRPS